MTTRPANSFVTDQTTRTTFGKVERGLGPYFLPSGERRWRVVYTEKDRVRGKAGFRTKAAAIHWQANNTSAIDTGTYLSPEKQKQNFGEYAERWLARREMKLRPKTQNLYRYLLSNLINPTFEDMRFKDISMEEVEDWHDQLTKSRSTNAKAYRLLRQILTAAVRHGHLQRNPADIEGAATEPRSTRPNVPDPDTVRLIADKVPERFRALILLAGFCGLRFGEAIALRKRDVDLLHKTVSVTKQVVEVNGSLSTGPPKTEGGTRTIHLLDELVPVLEAHLALTDTDLLFPARARSGRQSHLRRSSFRKNVWLPALKAAGLPPIHFHDLRHTHGMIAAATGMSRAARKQRMGHFSDRALEIYEHAMSDDPEKLASAMNLILAPAPAETDNVAAIRQ